MGVITRNKILQYGLLKQHDGHHKNACQKEVYLNMQTAYFKRKQGKGFHYYEVHGGPGRTPHGYQITINFLNPEPIIMVEHNYMTELTGTWCTYEAGEPISKEEYQAAYQKAVDSPDCEIY
jgi:hypothetical protein